MSWFSGKLHAPVTVRGGDASLYIKCDASTANQNFTEVGLETENNALDIGIDPTGNAYIESAVKALAMYGPARTAALKMDVTGSAFTGNLAAQRVTCDTLRANTVFVTSSLLEPQTLNVGMGTIRNLFADVVTANTGIFDRITTANLVTETMSVNAGVFSTVKTSNAATLGSLYLGGGDWEGKPAAFRVLPGTNGYTDNNILLRGNTSAHVTAWYGIGFATTYAANVTNAIINTRDGSFSTRSFLCATGQLGATPYQGNGAYLTFKDTSRCTVFSSVSGSNTVPGGWRFCSPTGNLAAVQLDNGIYVAAIDQIGNTALAGNVFNVLRANASATVGTVGINTSAPRDALHVIGNVLIDSGANRGASLTYGNIYLSDAASETVSGRMSLGNAGNNYQLNLEYDSARKPATATWSTVSDMRVKSNIELANLDECWNVVKAIPLKRFTWAEPIASKTGDARVVGWIAQDVRSVLPKAVTLTNEYGFTDFHSLNSDQLLKMMYGALQKSLTEVEQLKVRVAALESTP